MIAPAGRQRRGAGSDENAAVESSAGCDLAILSEDYARRTTATGSTCSFHAAGCLLAWSDATTAVLLRRAVIGDRVLRCPTSGAQVRAVRALRVQTRGGGHAGWGRG